MNHQFSDVVLMLGGNLGDTRRIFSKAIILLSENDCTVKAYSPLYESEPWGYADQPEFLNQAVLISTHLTPLELLYTIQEIENKLGRIRGIQNGPRTIDIDIIFYSDLVVDLPLLQIPHPRMHQRRFNLVPTCDIAPVWVHPLLKKTVSELLENCADPLQLKRLKN